MLNPIRPNREDEASIRAYLLQRGQDALRFYAGYQPNHIPDVQSHPVLAPTYPKMTEWGLDVMRRFFGHVVDYPNPRIPLLILLWSWLGEAHLYPMQPKSKNGQLIIQSLAEGFRILIAQSDIDLPFGGRQTGSSFSLTREQVLQFLLAHIEGRLLEDTSIYSKPKTESLKIRYHTVKLIQAQTLEWAYLSDADILNQLRPMLFRLYEQIRLTDV